MGQGLSLLCTGTQHDADFTLVLAGLIGGLFKKAWMVRSSRQAGSRRKSCGGPNAAEAGGGCWSKKSPHGEGGCVQALSSGKTQQEILGLVTRSLRPLL